MRAAIAGTLDPGGDPARRLRDAQAVVGDGGEGVAAGPLAIAWNTRRPAHRVRDELVCVVDGCVANTPELAAELDAPETSDDAAVVAHAFRRWGEASLVRLRGDFVVVLWEPRAQRALIARDQLGGGALFLHAAGGRVSFASEVRPLLDLLPSRPGPDQQFLAHWVALSDAGDGRTAFAGVTALGAGELLCFEGERWRRRTYWEPTYREPLALDQEEIACRVRSGMRRAVDRATRDAPGAALMLSGGLDSTSIAAVAVDDGRGERLRTYSLTFPDLPSMDESRWIDATIGALGLSGVRMAIRDGSMLAGALTFARDWALPLRPENLPLMRPLVARAAEDGATVLLDGEGGDLLFGPAYKLMADRILGGRPRSAVGLARTLPGAGDRPPWRRVARLSFDHGLRAALPASAHDVLRALGVERVDVPPWLLPAAAREVQDSTSEWRWTAREGPRWWARRARRSPSTSRRSASAITGAVAQPPPESRAQPLLRPGPGGAPAAIAAREWLQPPSQSSRAACRHRRHAPRRGTAASRQDLLQPAVLAINRTRRPHGGRAIAWRPGRRDPRGRRSRSGSRRPAPVLAGGPLSWVAYWTAAVWRLSSAECWMRIEADPAFADRFAEREQLHPLRFAFAES